MCGSWDWLKTTQNDLDPIFYNRTQNRTLVTNWVTLMTSLLSVKWIPRGSIWIITSKNSSRLNYFSMPKNFEFLKNSKFWGSRFDFLRWSWPRHFDHHVLILVVRWALTQVLLTLDAFAALTLIWATCDARKSRDRTTCMFHMPRQTMNVMFRRLD